MHVLVGRE